MADLFFFSNRHGECPLITAVLKDDVKIIEVLLKCGAHLTNADNPSITDIVNMAIRSGCLRKLESLKIAGASFDLRDELYQTPLHKVRHKSYTTFVGP